MYQKVITSGVFFICAYTDLRRHQIYKSVMTVYLILILLGHLISADAGLGQLLVAMIPGILTLLLAKASREAVGYGDGILILLCGLSLGLQACMEIALCAVCGAGLAAALLLSLRKADRKKEIPFAPFLFVGMLLQFM